MTDTNGNTVSTSFTHTAYFFVRTGMRKGRVYGYWKDGGRFKPEKDGNYFAFADMLPRGGWDGRIRFVKIGDPVPGNEEAPQRPIIDNNADEGEEVAED
jgi:hypothetical protein